MHLWGGYHAKMGWRGGFGRGKRRGMKWVIQTPGPLASGPSGLRIGSTESCIMLYSWFLMLATVSG